MKLSWFCSILSGSMKSNVILFNFIWFCNEWMNLMVTVCNLLNWSYQFSHCVQTAHWKMIALIWNELHLWTELIWKILDTYLENTELMLLVSHAQGNNELAWLHLSVIIWKIMSCTCNHDVTSFTIHKTHYVCANTTHYYLENNELQLHHCVQTQYTNQTALYTWQLWICPKYNSLL